MRRWKREKTMKIREPKKLTGYLKRYAKNVSSADKGAIVSNLIPGVKKVGRPLASLLAKGFDLGTLVSHDI